MADAITTDQSHEPAQSPGRAQLDEVTGSEELSNSLLKMVTPKGTPAGRVVGGSASEIANAVARERYELEDRRDPPPIPNGWYSILSSNQLVVGQVESIIAVARELVVYRDESEVAHVIAAHCPHLGAHLGGGHVRGENIECPYHGWRFGPDGTCVEIPYSEARIPSKACVPTYPTCEQDGFIFFWYHASGRPPAYEIPRLEEFDDQEWSAAYPWRYELTAALQEMAENNVDYAHLKYVHRRQYVPSDTSVFKTDGPFSTVVERLPDGTDFDRHTWGPGIALLRVPNLMTVYTTTTPIDRRHCRLDWHFYFARHAESMSEMMIEGVTGGYGLMADVPIWRDKVFFEQPLLVKADGNIAEFRRWYSQFYS